MNESCGGAATNTGQYDLSVPVFLFQVSQYPLLYGSLGAIRSLGRAGITCTSVVRAPLTPHRYSRYLAKSYPITAGRMNPLAGLLESLHNIGRDIGGPAVLLPTDDEAAVFASEHSSELKSRFLLSEVPPALPRKLASKHMLSGACAMHGIPSPRTELVHTFDEAMKVASQFGYPVVIKNNEPWSRLSAPVVSSTTTFGGARELLALRDTWLAMSKAIVQEYIPDAVAEDWIVHVYCGSRNKPLVFTGRKWRSWPPHGGVTTAATALRNEALADLSERFCCEMGFKGIADMDWRFDRRDCRYKLVDFNPRLGANFRLFETEAGIDVVRAMHLDLTGREIPSASPVYGRQFRVENLDWASRLVAENGAKAAPEGKVNGREYAWFATDDILPFVVMLVKFSALAAVRVAAIATRHIRAMRGRIGSALRHLHASQ